MSSRMINKHFAYDAILFIPENEISSSIWVFFWFRRFFFSAEKSMIPLVPLVPEVWFFPNLSYIFALLQNLMIPIQRISVPSAWNLNCAVWSCNTRHDVFLFVCFSSQFVGTIKLEILFRSVLAQFFIPFHFGLSATLRNHCLTCLSPCIMVFYLFTLPAVELCEEIFFSSYRGSHWTTFTLVSKVITVEFVFNSYSLLLVRNFKLHSQRIIIRFLRLRTVMNISF